MEETEGQRRVSRRQHSAHQGGSTVLEVPFEDHHDTWWQMSVALMKKQRQNIGGEGTKRNTNTPTQRHVITIIVIISSNSIIVIIRSIIIIIIIIIIITIIIIIIISSSRSNSLLDNLYNSGDSIIKQNNRLPPTSTSPFALCLHASSPHHAPRLSFVCLSSWSDCVPHNSNAADSSSNLITYDISCKKNVHARKQTSPAVRSRTSRTSSRRSWSKTPRAWLYQRDHHGMKSRNQKQWKYNKKRYTSSNSNFSHEIFLSHTSLTLSHAPQPATRCPHHTHTPASHESLSRALKAKGCCHCETWQRASGFQVQ